MKIFVKSQIFTLSLDVEPNNTILEVKNKIQEEKKYPASQFTFNYLIQIFKKKQFAKKLIKNL